MKVSRILILLAGSCLVHAQEGGDPLDAVPSLLDFTPDPSLLAPTPTPEPKVEDPRLERMKLLSRMTRTNAFPTLPEGHDITGMSRLPASDGDENLEETLEWISFETLQREVQERSKQEGRREIIALLEENLNKFTQKQIRNRMLEQLGLLYYQEATGTEDINSFHRSADYMEQALDIQPYSFRLLASLAGIYLYLNDVDKALSTLRRVDPALIPQDDVRNRFAIHFNYACAYSMHGDVEKSLTHLEQAANTDPANTYSSLGDPQLDGVREDEGFKRLSSSLKSFLYGKDNEETAESTSGN